MEDLRKIIEEANKTASNWDIMNSVLYEMCKSYPNHNDEKEIFGKTILIGRSYAAALERRKLKNKEGKQVLEDLDTDEFYNQVVTLFKKHNEEIDNLRDVSLETCLEKHKIWIDLFKIITNQNKRSFFSKYLHFHYPKNFYIYDSYAERGVSRILRDYGIKRETQKKKSYDNLDEFYAKFCYGIEDLQKELEKQNIKRLTPREMDNLLVYMGQ